MGSPRGKSPHHDPRQSSSLSPGPVRCLRTFRSSQMVEKWNPESLGGCRGRYPRRRFAGRIDFRSWISRPSPSREKPPRKRSKVGIEPAHSQAFMMMLDSDSTELLFHSCHADCALDCVNDVSDGGPKSVTIPGVVKQRSDQFIHPLDGPTDFLLRSDSRTTFRALARRDITVPIGIDNISAISW